MSEYEQLGPGENLLTFENVGFGGMPMQWFEVLYDMSVELPIDDIVVEFVTGKRPWFRQELSGLPRELCRRFTGTYHSSASKPKPWVEGASKIAKHSKKNGENENQNKAPDEIPFLLVTRRAIEVAVNASRDVYENVHTRNANKSWRELADTAGDCLKPLRKLIDALSEGECSISTKQTNVAYRLQIVWAKELGRRAAWPETFNTSKLRVKELIQAETTIAAINRLANEVADDWNPQILETQTRPELRAFVEIMAECWTFLSQASIGGAKDEDKNPFLRFAAQAWQDATGQEQSVHSQLPHVRSTPVRRPNWL